VSVHARRIVKAKHAAAAFSGDGARKYGGRWNSPGKPVVYVSSTMSLAILEMLVHHGSQELLKQYVLFEVTFDEGLLTAVDPAALPKRWRASPPAAAVQEVGDAWVAKGASVVLRVPSAIVPTEFNYLLNPAHPDFARIAVGPKQPVQFDPRLAGKPGF
jgi:RES domain-containing protein